MKRLTVIMWFLLSFNLFASASGLASIRFIHSDEYVLPYKYAFQLFSFSELHNIDVQHLQKWILKESSGNEKAFNKRTKDLGLCQLHDVNYLEQKYWDKDIRFNVWNGKHNLEVALSYLNDLINEFGIRKGFIAYNIGPTRTRAGRISITGKVYVASIFGESKAKVLISYIYSVPIHIMIYKESLLFTLRKSNNPLEIAT